MHSYGFQLTKTIKLFFLHLFLDVLKINIGIFYIINCLFPFKKEIITKNKNNLFNILEITYICVNAHRTRDYII